jgi:hypothetical protein
VPSAYHFGKACREAWSAWSADATSFPPHSSDNPQGTVYSLAAIRVPARSGYAALATSGRATKGGIPMNYRADEPRYREDVGLKDFKFGVIGLGTCAGLAILFAIIF